MCLLFGACVYVKSILVNNVIKEIEQTLFFPPLIDILILIYGWERNRNDFYNIHICANCQMSTNLVGFFLTFFLCWTRKEN